MVHEDWHKNLFKAHWNYFKKCVEYGTPGSWVQWDHICPGQILETTGPIFMIQKPYESPWILSFALDWSFLLSPESPWGLWRAHGAEILLNIFVGDHWADFGMLRPSYEVTWYKSCFCGFQLGLCGYIQNIVVLDNSSCSCQQSFHTH